VLERLRRARFRRGRDPQASRGEAERYVRRAPRPYAGAPSDPRDDAGPGTPPSQRGRRVMNEPGEASRGCRGRAVARRVSTHRGRPTLLTSSVVLVVSALAVLPLTASCSPRMPAPSAPVEATARLNGVAVPFIENEGQSDPRVAYYARTFSGTVFVTREGELVHALPAPAHRREAGVARDPGWTLT